MTNKEIGQKFFQIAKVLELKDSNDRFRIIAYERAAQTIENYPEDLNNVYQRGGLKELKNIPNIGSSIAEKIEELLKTGKIKYLDEISQAVPINEVQFIQIPGVGPKMAIKIARELKARDVEDLEKKIKTGQADNLFKEKTRANILRGIDIMRRLTGRMLLTEALPIAEKIISYLKKQTKVQKIDFVGSLRRMKETIGDIDIVAATSKPQELIDQFTSLAGVINILAKGSGKAMIIYEPNAHVDLEIVPENEYGSLLQHLTGSKEHNVALRAYALTIGRSVSEHGLKIIKEGKVKSRITCPDEECVYRNLKMDWIPPELRENRGEIVAARNHQLPKLVTLADIRGDLHVHSNWSDGLMSIEEIARRAQELKYEYVVIADHTVGLGIARGLDEKRLQDRQQEIEKVQKKYPNLKILSSVEVNIKANGDLDIQNWMLEKLDIVTASVHTSFFQDRATMTKRLLKAIAHPHVDIIGHPSGRIIGEREPVEVDWPAVFQSCVEHQTALEISAFPNRLDLKDTLCQEGKKFGVKFVISTDAHQSHHLDLMRFGVAVARRGWLEKENIVNCWPLNSLLKWAKR
jgi:DNA polymerase (family 10)